MTSASSAQRVRVAMSGTPCWKSARTARSAVNVTLELLDLLLLLGDDRLHQVADRYHADDAARLDHRQVAHALVGDQLHALLHRGIGRDREHLWGHDVAHRRVAGGAPAQ